MENVVRFGKSLALIDFDGAYSFGTKALGERMGGASSKFCTGVLPPEMVTRIDLVSEFPRLRQYEEYWRRVSEDAKDLNLLTPDDIQTISSVLKSLLAKADIARNLRKALPRTLRDEMGELYAGLEDRNDWKDILTISLMTISFEDLPLSLSRCQGVDEFANVWNRLLFHSKLWKKVKPRVTADDRFAYLIKSHDDINNEASNGDINSQSRLPYPLVKPAVTIDVWGFGVLLYALCSGGTLFHLGFNGNLRDTADFVELHEWDKHKAQKVLREKVDDPLALYLLSKILLPRDQRLPNMAAVLMHPFFGPSSNLEAQHILEKHEEQQLSIEETVVIKRMTTETRRKIERSMERQCKIIFDEDKIVVPTCVVVLPYELQRKDESLVVGSQAAAKLGVEVGRNLLEINKATAQASFYLMMKRRLGKGTKLHSSFKQKLKSWTKRARTEPPAKVCRSILSDIGCAPEYEGMCQQMLREGEDHSEGYLIDPMARARAVISNCTEQLMQCYSNAQNVYLVDEMNGVPVKSDEAIEDDYEGLEEVYPIALDRGKDTLKSLLLPFMNLAVMKLTAGEAGLVGLARLLGLPQAHGVPGSWKSGIVGLVHNPDKPSSIAEFAVLHDVMRRQERSKQIAAQGLGLTEGDLTESGKEMERLEDFFRDHDPVRTFSGLHRVSDGRDGSPAIWTTEAEVSKIEGELELASVEHRLRELKKEWIKKQRVQHRKAE